MTLAPTEADENDFSHLSIVIPAYNESEGIGITLKSLCDELPGSEIIVVDDGSTDDTAARVQQFPQVTLIQHKYNKGYGGAIKTGMRSASRELIAWFDADNEHKADLLKDMVCRLQAGRLAAVLGQRDRSVTALRGLGKMLIWMIARLLSGKASTDLNCGLRVFRRETIRPFIPLLPNGYSASLTSTIVLIERKLPFDFCPVTVNPRIGRSKVALSDGFATMLLVFRTVTLFAPLRIFLPMGAGTSFLGLAYSLWVALREWGGFPVLGAIVLLTGVLIALLGLIADQVSQMRLSEIDRVDASSLTVGRVDGQIARPPRQERQQPERS